MKKIPFNFPLVIGKEKLYLGQAYDQGNIHGDGHFTQLCARFFEQRFGTPKVLMTPSCTAALEMAAILCNLKAGDEVIMPSFTFVSTANAVVLQGARPVFVDIRHDTLNLDEELVEAAISPRTKAIFPVHYAGVSCDMDRIMAIARRHGLRVVEDAAQGVDANYKGKSLGAIADLGTYSFHETKNFTCGEGGALLVNDPALIERAEIIRDKGTNRKKFFRGEVDKYTWVDVGSSYVLSEINCACLWAQLEEMDPITERRLKIFARYREALEPLEAEGLVTLPRIPSDCSPNGHIFYVLTSEEKSRDELLAHLKRQNIHAVFHYIPLHTAPMGLKLGGKPGTLPVTESVSGRLLRLPIFYDLSEQDQERVIGQIYDFYRRTPPTNHKTEIPKPAYRAHLVDVDTRGAMR